MSTWDALEAVVRRARLALAADIAADKLSAGEIVRQAALIQDWAPGKFAAGAVRNHNGQTWQCYQAHDSTANPDWAPGSVGALWGCYHATDADHARAWIAPTGAHDTWQTGEYMIWTDGSVRRCKQDNTVYGPDILPDAWE